MRKCYNIINKLWRKYEKNNNCYVVGNDDNLC